MSRWSWCRVSARPVPNAWSSGCRRLVQKLLSESPTGPSERSAGCGAGDSVDREGVLNIGALNGTVCSPTLDSLGIEQYSLCSAIGVGVTYPDSEAVRGRLAKEGKRDCRLGGGQPRSGLRLRALAFERRGLLSCAQGRDEGLGQLVVDDRRDARCGRTSRRGAVVGDSRYLYTALGRLRDRRKAVLTQQLQDNQSVRLGDHDCRCDPSELQCGKPAIGQHGVQHRRVITADV